MPLEQDIANLQNNYQIGALKNTDPKIVANALLNSHTALLSSINSNLGGGGGSGSTSFNQALSSLTPVNGDAVIIEAAYAGREAILIFNASSTSLLGMAFGIDNIASVNDTTISLVVAPQTSQLIELPTLVSKAIALKSLDGSQIQFVYHVKDDTGGA